MWRLAAWPCLVESTAGCRWSGPSQPGSWLPKATRLAQTCSFGQRGKCAWLARVAWRCLWCGRTARKAEGSGVSNHNNRQAGRQVTTREGKIRAASTCLQRSLGGRQQPYRHVEQVVWWHAAQQPAQPRHAPGALNICSNAPQSQGAHSAPFCGRLAQQQQALASRAGAHGAGWLVRSASAAGPQCCQPQAPTCASWKADGAGDRLLQQGQQRQAAHRATPLGTARQENLSHSQIARLLHAAMGRRCRAFVSATITPSCSRVNYGGQPLHFNTGPAVARSWHLAGSCKQSSGFQSMHAGQGAGGERAAAVGWPAQPPRLQCLLVQRGLGDSSSP